MIDVYLGLGSNLGERLANLEQGMAKLAEEPGVEVVHWVEPLETEPVGGPPGQPWFMNSACLARTDLSPLEFLDAVNRVERAVGRRRENETSRWGPRELDIDILYWGEQTVDHPRLQIPHPLLVERTFVLEPLSRLAPDLKHPVLALTAGEMLRNLVGERG